MWGCEVIAYILIVIVMSYGSYDRPQASVVMQEFSNIKACQAAIEEVKRSNGDFVRMRMSCVPKGNP